MKNDNTSLLIEPLYIDVENGGVSVRASVCEQYMSILWYEMVSEYKH